MKTFLFFFAMVFAGNSTYAQTERQIYPANYISPEKLSTFVLSNMPQKDKRFDVNANKSYLITADSIVVNGKKLDSLSNLKVLFGGTLQLTEKSGEDSSRFFRRIFFNTSVNPMPQSLMKGYYAFTRNNVTVNIVDKAYKTPKVYSSTKMDILVLVPKVYAGAPRDESYWKAGLAFLNNITFYY